MMAHELLHTMGKKRKSKQFFFDLKLDVEKGYDRLEWDFIELMLKKFNFLLVVQNWILNYIKTPTFQVKVNGFLSEPWNPTRGIHQGDSLSPYIFISTSLSCVKNSLSIF